MRALLVVNPAATTTTPRTREVLVSALGADLKVDVAETAYRGHASDLAASAAANGYDVVVALGGDGTVNEIVNGLLRHGPSPDLPTLAVVPGGSTNVFVRSLGFCASPVEAAGQLLESLRARRTRIIGLGRADDRLFTFCAGIGLDAGVVGRVERRRAEGRPASQGLYVRSAVVRYSSSRRRHPALRLAVPGEPEQPLGLALVCNTTPWTYFRSHPLNPCPDASFDLGLDVFGLTRLRLPSVLRSVAQFAQPAERGGPRGRPVVRRHDLATFTVRATSPQPFQVDGDYLGERDEVTFTAVPSVLRVIVA